MASNDRKRVQNTLDYETQALTNRQNEAWSPAFTGYNEGTKAALSDYGNIMGQYNNFAQTGGFSNEDMANIRARGVSPMRSVYQNAQADIARQSGLSGGYAPNAIAAQTRLARNMGQGLSDATQNNEANLAQMMQQGKLAGLGGMAGMYGSTPGLASSFGNDVMNLLGLQQGIAQFKQGGQMQHSQLPTGFQSAMGHLGNIANIGSTVANIPNIWKREK